MTSLPFVLAAASALAGLSALAPQTPPVVPVPVPVAAHLTAPVPRDALATAAPPAARPAPAFGWPLTPAPVVLRRFVVGPQPWSPGHRGVDLAAGAGQPVLAAGSGTVSFAGPVAGRGVVAVLHEGGVRTTYEPVTAKVRRGDVVSRGTPLGVLAGGPHCAGPCLHWGALRGETYLDPLSLLGPPAPPVLLPLGRPVAV